MDYDALSADRQLERAFKATIAEIFAQFIGDGVNDSMVAVSLSSGPNVMAASMLDRDGQALFVGIVIEPPSDVSLHRVAAKLKNSAALMLSLARRLSSLPGIAKTLSGNLTTSSPLTLGPLSDPVVESPFEIGESNCPCMSINVGDRQKENSTLVTIGVKVVPYPVGLTAGTCDSWDEGRYPGACDNRDAPSWCEKKWCYVDPCNCDTEQNLCSLFWGRSYWQESDSLLVFDVWRKRQFFRPLFR